MPATTGSADGQRGSELGMALADGREEVLDGAALGQLEREQGRPGEPGQAGSEPDSDLHAHAPFGWAAQS